MHHHEPLTELPLVVPPSRPDAMHTDAADALCDLQARYDAATRFLRESFARVMAGAPPDGHYRAFYPNVTLTTASFAKVDSRCRSATWPSPGSTRRRSPGRSCSGLPHPAARAPDPEPRMPVRVGTSDTPIPLHFAMGEDAHVAGSIEDVLHRPLRDVFDVPDLDNTDDHIVNGTARPTAAGVRPLAPFTAQRIDYSLARLAHYTATSVGHFQNHVLFTNYQFYMDEFVEYALAAIADPDSGYVAFVEPGNAVITREGRTGAPTARLPQMPAFHLIGPNHSGISMINIGVGPSNAKTITDHIAVLRPHVWLMVGHCAGLRNSQSLGDYVLAHAYMREDHVLDDDLPVWVPIPALAEVQVALENAVAEVTGLEGYELKKVMRTGTVATIDNRNWELDDQSGPVARLSQARAIALDMESATIAANGFRFRVPYGTLLCVSDKPLHGELKLPGMATAFYKRQVAQHLRIGIRAVESLRDMPLEKLHSRKLRSFDETAFL